MLIGKCWIEMKDNFYNKETNRTENVLKNKDVLKILNCDHLGKEKGRSRYFVCGEGVWLEDWIISHLSWLKFYNYSKENK